MRRIGTAVSLLALLTACQPAAPKVDAAAEEAAIRAQAAAFQTAVTAYDEAAVGAGLMRPTPGSCRPTWRR